MVTIINESSSEIKPNKRSYYTSNKSNMFIKNAITGSFYDYKVGSFKSAQLFKVVDTIGHHDKDGRNIKNITGFNCSPNHLYYDTPEEFMRHRNCSLSQELINAWYKKTKELFPTKIAETAVN